MMDYGRSYLPMNVLSEQWGGTRSSKHGAHALEYSQSHAQEAQVLPVQPKQDLYPFHYRPDTTAHPHWKRFATKDKGCK